MPQADVSKLVSQLKFKISPSYKRLKNPDGPKGRHVIIKDIITGLFKYERIEVGYTKADEARGFAERLISEAIRHGDTHKPTMDLADYWIGEKQVVHKLFKVLAPRYQNYSVSFTRIHRLSSFHPDGPRPRSLLELKGNPFPSLIPNHSSNRNLIHNVLLEEARKEYRAQKYSEMADQLASQDPSEEVTEDNNPAGQASSIDQKSSNKQTTT